MFLVYQGIIVANTMLSDAGNRIRANQAKYQLFLHAIRATSVQQVELSY